MRADSPEFRPQGPMQVLGEIRFRPAIRCEGKIGGRDRDRTGDPLLAKQVLSQLSYTPTVEVTLILKHFRARRNPFLRILVKTVPKLFQNPRLQRQVLGNAESFDWLGG